MMTPNTIFNFSYSVLTSDGRTYGIDDCTKKGVFEAWNYLRDRGLNVSASTVRLSRKQREYAITQRSPYFDSKDHLMKHLQKRLRDEERNPRLEVVEVHFCFKRIK